MDASKYLMRDLSSFKRNVLDETAAFQDLLMAFFPVISHWEFVRSLDRD